MHKAIIVAMLFFPGVAVGQTAGSGGGSSGARGIAVCYNPNAGTEWAPRGGTCYAADDPANLHSSPKEMTYKTYPVPPGTRQVTITHNGKQTVIDVPKGVATIYIWSGGAGAGGAGGASGGGGSAPAAGIGPEELER